MTDGISKTQLVMLRGSLRSMVVLGLIYALAHVVNAFRGNLNWHAQVDTHRSLRLPLAERVDAIWQGEVLLILEDPSIRLSILAALPFVIVGLGAAVVGFSLLRITFATNEGDPFFDTSARRLRAISRVIAIVAVLSAITHSVANTEIVQAAMASDDDSVSADLRLGPMLAGLLLALVVRVIAEAFRIGTELRRDTEGLV